MLPFVIVQSRDVKLSSILMRFFGLQQAVMSSRSLLRNNKPEFFLFRCCTLVRLNHIIIITELLPEDRLVIVIRYNSFSLDQYDTVIKYK